MPEIPDFTKEEIDFLLTLVNNVKIEGVTLANMEKFKQRIAEMEQIKEKLTALAPQEKKK